MVNFAWIIIAIALVTSILLYALNRSGSAETKRKMAEKEGLSTRTRSRTPRVSPEN